MSAGSTYTPIATTTISGSSVSTVSYGGFSGYTDLIVIAQFKSTTSDVRLRFNSDAGSNYSGTRLYGYGTGLASDRQSNATQILFNIGGTSTNWQQVICNIQDYSNATTWKTCLTKINNPTDLINAQISLWRNTNPITLIEIDVNGGVFNSGSTFTLYGIKAA